MEYPMDFFTNARNLQIRYDSNHDQGPNMYPHHHVHPFQVSYDLPFTPVPRPQKLKFENLDKRVQRELENLRDILKDDTRRRALVDLEGDEAQYKLDLLQLLLELTDEKDMRTRIWKVLTRLSKDSNCAPRCLIIRKIVPLGDRPIGGGGYGDVWKGMFGDPETGQVECAIKIGKLYMDEDGVDAYEKVIKGHLREALLWAQLKHPNVLPFLGMYYRDPSEKDLCLVSPYMKNGNLAKFLGRTNPEDIDDHGLVHDITSGIEYLHSEDIVHGDLKDANILIRGDGIRAYACICDFGLSRLAMTYGLGLTMSRWGVTLGYTAPEVLFGQLASKESDMYSYGRLCFSILSKLYDLPSSIDQNSPPSRPNNVPEDKEWLWSLLCECWKRDASTRPTAQDALQRVIAVNVEISRAPSWDESLHSRIRGHVDIYPLLNYLTVSSRRSGSHAPQEEE
ncbi:hypothetical protein PM082_000309 [Marasmius tenuissimus]|nr:hypothetical protein PM082_000309 [Marasmius tenuissimus]